MATCTGEFVVGSLGISIKENIKFEMGGVLLTCRRWNETEDLAREMKQRH